MKKAARAAVILSVLAVMMLCLTTVSFAGTKKVKIDFRCAMPNSCMAYYDGLEVSSDKAEKYCANQVPDIGIYENDFAGDEATYLDALVAASIKRYGGRGDVELHDNDTYAWVVKAFGGNLYGALVNGVPVSSVHQKIKSGDTVTALTFTTGTWKNKRGLYFEKKEYKTYVGSKVSAKLTGVDVMFGGLCSEFDTVSLWSLDPSTCRLADFKGAVRNKNVYTFSFQKAGTYYFMASAANPDPDDPSPEATRLEYYGAFTKIVVNDIVPAKPKITSAKRISKTKAKVAWKKAKNAKKYQVAYRIKKTSKWKTKTTNKTKITLTRLKAKKVYQVKVRSINGTSKSAYSKVKTIKAK